MDIQLKVDKVSKAYAQHLALDNVSLEVPKGQIFGLLGPNGAGKTTLIRIINQITGPDSGLVYLGGQPLAPNHIANIGYLPEERGLYKKMKVGEQLQYLAQLKGMSKTDATEKLKHWFIKFDIKDWWNKNVEDLSKGMQQKTQFIATIVHEPSLIILDEPFSGFDPINANLLKDEILELKEKGSTIIFSTHRMESVEELCDHIALINKSKVVLAGSKKEIKEQFKDNLYQITHTGPIGTTGQNYQLVSQISLADGNTRSQVKILSNGNSVLEELLPQTQIVAFEEKIPSFNDIFIKVVGQNNEELA
jgi:ABC-2 type transport system ATP-binding protein